MLRSWFTENCLILNLKKGKTEFVLYGSKQKLAKKHDCDIIKNNEPVTKAKSYEYLGVTLDSSLLLHLQLNRIYKKASSRLKLLSRIRANISPTVAETIYNMILPILLYCHPNYCNLSPSSISKLESVQRRAEKIVRLSNSKWETMRKNSLYRHI